MERTKFPRTYHLPWSECVASDDKTLGSVVQFAGSEVVVTEKLDGENTTIYPDGLAHARSVDSPATPARAWVRGLAGQIAHDIPPGWRVCGENVHMRRSIAYDRLTTFFYVFGIYDGDRCLAWDDAAAYAEQLGLQTVPVLWRGVWDPDAIQALHPRPGSFSEHCEGYVVRLAEAFTLRSYRDSVAKFVRRDHVLEHVVVGTDGKSRIVRPEDRCVPNVLTQDGQDRPADMASGRTALQEPVEG